MNIRNNVVLIGRIGNQLELKNKEEFTFINFSIAVDDSYFDKEKQKKEERTQWINCVAKNKQAEHIVKNYSKGDQIAINGKLVSRVYEIEGEKKYIVEVEIQNTDILLRKQKKNED